jgi:hypothetical protein
MPKSSTPAGWVVQVATPLPEGEPPKFAYFNVNEPDAEKAIAATRKKANGDETATFQAIRPLSSAEVEKLGLRQHQVEPA